MPEIQGQVPELLQGLKYEVEFDFVHAGFQEVTGLSDESEVADYRESTDPFAMRKLPGLSTYPVIALKRGLSQNDELLKWRQEIVIAGRGARDERVGSGREFRRNGIINLRDRAGVIRVTWQILHAWPSKLEWSDLSAGSSDVLIETLELTHEGLRRIEPGRGTGAGATGAPR